MDRRAGRGNRGAGGGLPLRAGPGDADRDHGGTGRGAELGILFKGGESLERLETVGAVFLDKTGTITAASRS